jgi:hypothetical protein
MTLPHPSLPAISQARGAGNGSGSDELLDVDVMKWQMLQVCELCFQMTFMYTMHGEFVFHLLIADCHQNSTTCSAHDLPQARRFDILTFSLGIMKHISITV